MMIKSFRRVFNPTVEEQKEDFLFLKKIHDELVKEKGCSTCIHCIHVINYPGFVTGEECECDVGLECDTVLFKVKNCEKWEEDRLYEED